MKKEIIKKQIDNYIELTEQYNSFLTLILVANVEGKTTIFDDYRDTSVLSEYFTLEEYETLSRTYKKLGYEVLCYFSEDSFMSAILNQKLSIDHKKILVINSAQTGTYIGRKSLIPAFCEHFKIMHTGSNPYVVSLCRDKFHSNIIINKCIDTHMDTYLFSATDGWLGDKLPPIGTKLIAKLNGESASIGLSPNNTFVYTEDTEKYLCQLSRQYMQPIVIQSFISGYELELPMIIGTEVLPLVAAGIKMYDTEILGDKFLDYNARLYHTYDFYNFDNFSPNLSIKVKENAKKAAKILGIEGFGRIDFRITPTGECYVSDIATNPHITEDSSFAFVFQELGYSYSEMLATQIGITLSKYLTTTDEENYISLQ